MPPSGLLEVIEMIEQRRVPAAEADLASKGKPAPVPRFLDLLPARDFERLGGSLTSDALARFLFPDGLEEYDGRAAIVSRFRRWFCSPSGFDLAPLTSAKV